MISAKDVHKSFGDLEVLKGVSMDVMKMTYWFTYVRAAEASMTPGHSDNHG